MPLPTTLKGFGNEYEQCLLRAHNALSTGAEEYVIQFASPNIATSMRGRVYAYFKALRNSTERPDLTALCTDVSLRCAGSALVFFRSEDALDRVRMREALGLQPGFDAVETRGVIAPDSSLTANMEKLTAIRKRK